MEQVVQELDGSRLSVKAADEKEADACEGHHLLGGLALDTEGCRKGERSDDEGDHVAHHAIKHGIFQRWVAKDEDEDDCHGGGCEDAGKEASEAEGWFH